MSPEAKVCERCGANFDRATYGAKQESAQRFAARRFCSLTCANARPGRQSCSVPGCDKRHLARGWCATHYQRWRTTGEAGDATMRWQPADPDATEKPCTRCAMVKPLADFYADARKRDGRQSDCKACFGARQRARAIKRKYGLTVEQHDELLAAQDERCAICRSDDELVVDHDHTTGRVRGLLCNGCNTALGMAKDDPGRLRAAADYLEVHNMLDHHDHQAVR